MTDKERGHSQSATGSKKDNDAIYGHRCLNQ